VYIIVEEGITSTNIKEIVTMAYYSFKAKNGDKYTAEIYSKKAPIGYVVVGNMDITKKNGVHKHLSNSMKFVSSQVKADVLIVAHKKKFNSYRK